MNNFLRKPQERFLKITMLLWFVFLGQNSWAQNMTQTIRGFVTDAYTHNGLVGATVFIPSLEMGVTTDENGSFRLEAVPVGRHRLQVSFIGYETLIISEILLESGKELVLEIDLTESNATLREVVVKGIVPNQRNLIFPTAEILTIEETLRLPATFNDPARLALSYAGVNTNNDQANHMVIRGNSPNNMSWRLEGVEIVNPNHLSNGGTDTDRPSQNGGGVNILSSQLLGNSTFMRGAFPASYGNVLSGVMDMNFRKGNDETYEFTGQIGVVGLDLAAEGPLSKKSKSSFLANYRYSTLGFLSTAGVDLGDESFTFQDVAVHLSFPLVRGGNLSFFGFGGTSENDFQAKEAKDWRVQKDQFNINYKSKMGAMGIKLQQPINEKWNWNFSSVYSSMTAERNSDRFAFLNSVFTIFEPFERDDFSQQKFSTNTFLKYRLEKNSHIRFGVVNTWIKDKQVLFSKILETQLSGGIIDGTLFYPYIDVEYGFSNLTINLGTRSVFFTYNSTSSLESSMNVKWNFLEKNTIGFVYGSQSQRQLPQIYATANVASENEKLELTKSHDFSLIYEHKRNQNLRFRVETYYQFLMDVPIAKDVSNSFSALNVFENSINLPLVSKGTGENYGIELTAQQYFYKNTFWLGNVSLYESKYKGSDGVERDTRFNGNYIVNATFGKEFPYSRKAKDYIFGLNIHANISGGLRETPIDEVASELAEETVFLEAAAFSLQQKDYFKTDLRIYWKRNKKQFNSTLALDIQNVTNTKNPSFRYYDTLLNRVEQKYQLGIIPILSYRIEW